MCRMSTQNMDTALVAESVSVRAETSRLEWPLCGAGELRNYVVDFFPRLDQTGTPTITFVQEIRVGHRILKSAEIWRQPFDRARSASDLFDWLLSRQEDWNLWGRMPLAFPPAEILAAGHAFVKAERATKAEALREKRQKAKKERQQAKKIESYLVNDDDRGFGINLQRGNAKKGFFVLWFRENWERERFRDWFRLQRAADRLPEFAAYYDEHGSLALERMMLREMLETERKVKAAGLGSGGRRPLRFYRGED